MKMPSCRLLSVLVATFLAGACRATPAPPTAVPESTWATVDGRAVTQDDVNKAYGRMTDPSQPLSDEETLTAKLTMLNELILQDILIAKASALKIDVAASEIDTAYAAAKQAIPEEAFQQELTKRGLTVAEMREGLRRELLSQKVIQQEVGSKVAVTAQEVSDFFIANQTQFNIPEEAYHLAQIVITPVREAQVANRTRDDAATPQAAEAKLAMLMERLKTGTPFGELAMDYSEDPESAPRGGDLGLVPVASLKQAPAQLRNAVLNQKPGTVNVVSASGAHSVVLVVAHELAGQRDLATPGIRDRITDTLRARKEQLLRTAYLTALREDAQVVNYFARRLVESQGNAPDPQAAAPAGK